MPKAVENPDSRPMPIKPTTPRLTKMGTPAAKSKIKATTLSIARRVGDRIMI